MLHVISLESTRIANSSIGIVKRLTPRVNMVYEDRCTTYMVLEREGVLLTTGCWALVQWNCCDATTFGDGQSCTLTCGQ